MKRLLVLIGLIMLCIQSFAQQSFKWGVSTGSISSDDATDIISFENHTIVSGTFRETIYFGENEVQSSGNKDIFLASLNKNGRPEWLINLGGRGNDKSDCLAKGEDCIYMTGEIRGSVKVGEEEFEGEGEALFLCSVSKKGKVNWFTRVPYTGSSSIDVLEISPSGELLVGGMISGTMEAAGETLDSGFGKRAFLLTISKDGKVLDAEISLGKGTHRLVSVSVNKDGSRYLVFHITGYLLFGTNSEGHYRSDSDFRGLVLVKENRGETIWTKYLQCPDYIQGVKAINRKDGGLTACINFTKELVSTDTTLYTKGLQDVALFTYTKTGELKWLQQLKSPVICYAMDATQTRDGKLLLTGYFKGSYFNNNKEVALRNDYSESMFLAQFNSNGTLTWHDEPGGEASAFGRRIALNEEGDILMAGKFRDKIALGENKFASNGKYDVLVAHYSNCEKQEVKIEPYGALCRGESLELGVSKHNFESYLWDGVAWGDQITIENPGIYTLEAFDGSGCIARDTIDIQLVSVHSLDLPPVIELNPDREMILTANEGFVNYTWEDGETGNSRIVDYYENTDSIQLVLNAETEQGCMATDTTVVYFVNSDSAAKEQDEKSSGFRVWPNPVEESLWWFVQGAGTMEVRVELSDSKSVLVYTEECSSYQPGMHRQVNVRDLASGYYLFSVWVGDKVYSEKIIKK